MERAYIFLAYQKNVGSLRKKLFRTPFAYGERRAKPVFLAIYSYAHHSIKIKFFREQKH